MTTFYLIRHADAYPGTEENIQFPTTPLNKEGIKEAKKLRKRLKKINASILLTSPHRRAIETMEIATKGKKLDAVVVDGLEEVGSDFWPNPDVLWFEVKEPSTFKKTQRNVRDLFDDLWKKYKKETVLVFTHGNWIRCLVTSLLGSGWKGFNRIVINLASITIIDGGEENIPRIATLSDFSHLL